MLSKSLRQWFQGGSLGSGQKRRIRRKNRMAAASETVEQRQLLTVFTWDGGGDGVSFADKDNWAVDGQLQPDAAPGAGDDTIIDLDGAGSVYTIRISGDEQVNSLLISDDDAQLRVDGGSLTSGSVTIDAGQLIAINADLIADTVTNNDRIAGARTVLMDVDQFANNSIFTVQSSSSTNLTFDGDFVNSGVFNFNAAGTSGGTLSVNNGLFTNQSTGTVTIGGPDTRTQTLRASIQNDGNLRFNSLITWNEPGASIVSTGDLTFAAESRLSTFGSSVLVEIRDGSASFDGDAFLSNGTFTVSGGDVEISDLVRVDNDGTINVSGGTIETETGRLLLNQRGDFNFSGGDIIGANAVQIFGTTNLNLSHDGSFNAETSGSTTVSGSLSELQTLSVIASNSGLSFSPNSVNHGTIIFDNPAASGQRLSTTDGAPFENGETGFVRFTRSGSTTAIGTFIQVPVNNAGAFEVDTIVSDSKLNTFTNSGTFIVTENGRYTRSTAGSGTGSAFIQADGTVTNNGRFDGGGLTFEYSGGDAIGTFTPGNLVVNPGSGNTGVFKPTNTIAGDIQAGQTVVVDRAGVDINSDVTNAGTIRFLAPADGSQATLTLNNALLTNLETGVVAFEADAGLSAFVFGNIVNDGTIQVDRGIARIDGILNRSSVTVGTDTTLFFRQNTSFVQEEGVLDLQGTGRFNGLFSHQGGAIVGIPSLGENSALEISDSASPAEFVRTDGGDFLSDIPAGATVTLSNPGGTGSIDRYDAFDGFTIEGNLLFGDDATTGDTIELETLGEVIIGSTGVVETNGAVGNRVISATLVNNGSLTVNASTLFTAPDAIHTNNGDLHLNDQTATFAGEGLTNEIEGAITGTGTLNLDDGVFGSQPTVFTNRGVIAAGQSPGEILVNSTSAVLESTSRVLTEIGGIASGTGHDVLNFSGDLQLGGLFDIQLIDGFSPSLNDTFVPILADAVSGVFDIIQGANVGVHQVFDVAVNPADVTLTMADADVDLVTSVGNVPSSVFAGDEMNVEISVTNSGTGTADLPIQVNIYLQAEGKFDVAQAFKVRAIQLGGASQSLAPGETISQVVTLEVPGVAEDEFCVYAVADTEQANADISRENNIGSSPEKVQVFYRRISFGQTTTDSLEPGRTAFYALELPANTPATVSVMTSAPGSYEVYDHRFSRGEDNTNETPFGCDVEDGIETCENSYAELFESTRFIAIRSTSNDSTPYQVSWAGSPNRITAISVKKASANRQFTTSVRGSGFVEGVTPILTRNGQFFTQASSIDLVNTNLMNIRWPALPEGDYELKLIDFNGNEFECTDADGCSIEIGAEVSEDSFNVLYSFTGPANARAFRSIPYLLNYNNPNPGDADSELVIVSAENGTFEDGSQTRGFYTSGVGGSRTIESGLTDSIGFTLIPDGTGPVSLTATTVSQVIETQVPGLQPSALLPRMIVTEGENFCIEVGSSDQVVVVRGSGFAESLPGGVTRPDGSSENIYNLIIFDSQDNVIGGSRGVPGERISDTELRFDLSEFNLQPGKYRVNSVGRNPNSTSRRFVDLNATLEVKQPGTPGTVPDRIFFVAGNVQSAIQNANQLGLRTQGEILVGNSIAFNQARLISQISSLASLGISNVQSVTALAGAQTNAHTQSGQLFNTLSIAPTDLPPNNRPPGVPPMVVNRAEQLCIETDDPTPVIVLRGRGFEKFSNGNENGYHIEILDSKGNRVVDLSATLFGERISDTELQFDITELNLGEGVYTIVSLDRNPNFSGDGIPNDSLPLKIRFEVKAPGAKGTVPESVVVYAENPFSTGHHNPLAFRRQNITPDAAKFVVAGLNFLVGFNPDGTVITGSPQLGDVAREGDNLRFSTRHMVDYVVNAETGQLVSRTNNATGETQKPVHDVLGRIVKMVQDVNGRNEVVEQYTYNQNNLITSLFTATQSGNQAFDQEGRLEFITVNGVTTRFEYEEFISIGGFNGVAISAIEHNGQRFVFLYDELGRISSIFNQTTGTDYTFHYSSGRLTKITGSDGSVFLPELSEQETNLVSEYANPAPITGLANEHSVRNSFSNAVVPLSLKNIVSPVTSDKDSDSIDPDLHNSITELNSALPETALPASNVAQGPVDSNGNGPGPAPSLADNFDAELFNSFVRILQNSSNVEVARIGTELVFAFDPNDIIGPAGVGPENHVRVDASMPYTIRFENIDTATAPAQEVFVTQQLDADLDLSSFEFQSFGWGDLEFTVSAGLQAFNRVIDLRPSQDLVVDVSASLDQATRTIDWAFRSLDPLTGDLPADPFAGFLPPNVIRGNW